MSQFRIPTSNLKQGMLQQAKQEAKKEAAKKEQAQTSEAVENAAENAEFTGDADGPDAALLKKMRQKRRAKGATAEEGQRTRRGPQRWRSRFRNVDRQCRFSKGKGSDLLGGDSFGEDNRREMIEQYLLGHIKKTTTTSRNCGPKEKKTSSTLSLMPRALKSLGLKQRDTWCGCLIFGGNKASTVLKPSRNPPAC